LELTNISTDQVILWQWGFVKINATLAYTWLVMAILALGSWLVTRRLSPDPPLARGQNLLEVVVGGMRDHVRDVSQMEEVPPWFPMLATLFLFIGLSNLLDIVPGFHSPAGSLSTTAALAGCVFLAVPLFGIGRLGLGAYLKRYVEPTPLMLPFHVLGELSRTIALAVRLFGNVMSGTKIAMILLAVSPFLFPVVMQVLGLVTGLIHAYIFALLAAVYIASASRTRAQEGGQAEEEEGKGRPDTGETEENAGGTQEKTPGEAGTGNDGGSREAPETSGDRKDRDRSGAAEERGSNDAQSDEPKKKEGDE
jgi:F-type H+-transporting ATPase subunit a